MATIDDPLQEGETVAMPCKHQIMTGGRATGRSIRRYGPPRWIPCALLVAALLIAALLALPQETQRAQAAPPPNPSSIYFLSYCSNTFQTTALNTAFSENLSVCVGRWADVGARNNHVAGIAVTFTAIPSRAGASGTFANGTNTVTITSGSSGMATATTFTANGTPGAYVVTVTAEDTSPTSFSMTNGDSSVPAVLSIGDGSNQAAQVNNQLSQINTAFRIPLSVTVLDGQNHYLPGVTVTFTAPDTGASGTFANGTITTTATTNSTGVATASTFTANGTDGIYSLMVSVGTLTNSFTLQNTRDNPFGVPITISLSQGSPQTVDIETSFPSILQVVVLDGALKYVPNVTVTFTAVPGLTGASGTFANGTGTTTATTGPTGLADATRLTANHAAGQFSILVTAGQASTSAVFYNLAIETTTTLTNAPTTTIYGQSVALTATVSPVRGTSVPTGFVAFKDNGTVITECKKVPLSGNVATCQATTVNAGARQITAEYLGDAGLFPSTSNPVTQTVNQASTSITLRSSLNPSTVNQRVTFTASVTAQAPGGGTPTGTVTFMDGTTPLGTPVTLDKGQVAVSIATLGPGDHAITATYSGDPNFLTSTSAPPLTQTVAVIPTQFAVTNYPSPTTAGVSHTVTVTAMDDAGTIATTYSGTVTLAVSDVQAVVGATQPLTGGTGTFAVTFTSAGTQTITVTGPAPNGGGTISGSQSGIVVQPAAAASVVAISGDSQSGNVGMPFTQPLVVKVTDAFGNLVPGAVVTFTGPASGASATFSPNPAPTGSQGTAQTTATANAIAGGPYTASATVQGIAVPAAFALTNTAIPIELTGIAIMAGNTPATTLMLTIGQSSQLTALKVFRDGSTQPLSGAQWTVSDPHIASVDANGKVTGLSPGTATITVRLNGVTQTLTITVLGQTSGGSMPVPGSRSSGATSATAPPAPVPNRGGSASPASGGGPTPNPAPTGR